MSGIEREGAKRRIKAAIDLIRVASDTTLRWSEDSLRNALAWLESTEAWAKRSGDAGEVRSIVEEIRAEERASVLGLDDFDDLITARDVFVKNLISRPVGHQEGAETYACLREASSADADARASAACHFGRVLQSGARAEAARMLLARTRRDVGRGRRPAVEALLESTSSEEDETEGERGSHGALWASFLDYLLSWRLVCLSAIVGLRRDRVRGDLDDLFLAIEEHNQSQDLLDDDGGSGARSSASINPHECCCVFLLSKVWTRVIHDARNCKPLRSGLPLTPAPTAPTRDRGEASALSKLMAALRGGSPEEDTNLRGIHPGLLATVALHAGDSEFLQAYRTWCRRERSGEGSDHERWFGLLFSCN